MRYPVKTKAWNSTGVSRFIKESAVYLVPIILPASLHRWYANTFSIKPWNPKVFRHRFSSARKIIWLESRKRDILGTPLDATSKQIEVEHFRKLCRYLDGIDKALFLDFLRPFNYCWMYIFIDLRFHEKFGAVHKKRRDLFGRFWHPPSPKLEFWPWFI